MNYRHLYHAGNFADVFKHIIVVKCLEKLRAKETPFCVLDTHAGIGMYDLASETAEKTEEYKQGIHQLLAATKKSDVFDSYLKIVHSFNGADCRYYPGSPAIANQLLRSQDRLVLSELHTEDSNTLKYHFRHEKQVSVHHMDAYVSMKAFLPPKEKRGLVLIDPPFEEENEFERITQTLEMAHQRFHHGIYAIWYPIKDRLSVNYFHNALLATNIPKILALELLLQPENTPNALNGCGMIIINAPWKIDSDATIWLPELAKILGQERKSSTRIEWLRE